MGKKVMMIIINEMINDTLIFSEIMLTSKGRDKVFSLAQYIMELYIKCMANSREFSHLVQ